MNTLTKHLVLLVLCLSFASVNAQDTIQKSTKQVEIEKLLSLKETIQNEEKAQLKTEVEAINKQFENGEITQEKAEELKLEAA
ncbi:MAG: hypothetical protein KDD16_14085, partial [Mangrovimonas sp.]|nr:hypothetical protein [Mangrovimonas sp.]